MRRAGFRPCSLGPRMRHVLFASFQRRRSRAEIVGYWHFSTPDALSDDVRWSVCNSGAPGPRGFRRLVGFPQGVLQGFRNPVHPIVR